MYILFEYIPLPLRGDFQWVFLDGKVDFPTATIFIDFYMGNFTFNLMLRLTFGLQQTLIKIKVNLRCKVQSANVMTHEDVSNQTEIQK